MDPHTEDHSCSVWQVPCCSIIWTDTSSPPWQPPPRPLHGVGTGRARGQVWWGCKCSGERSDVGILSSGWVTGRCCGWCCWTLRSLIPGLFLLCHLCHDGSGINLCPLKQKQDHQVPFIFDTRKQNGGICGFPVVSLKTYQGSGICRGKCSVCTPI